MTYIAMPKSLNHSGCISIRYGEERRDDTFAIVADCGIESVELPDSLTRYIKESVGWIIDMSFPELVRAIYCFYPEYQENSRFAYDGEQAIIESFARGLKQSREGKHTRPPTCSPRCNRLKPLHG